MLLGMEWYWWLLIIILAALSIPIKVKLIKWWNIKMQDKKNNHNDKWGDEE